MQRKLPPGRSLRLSEAYEAAAGGALVAVPGIAVCVSCGLSSASMLRHRTHHVQVVALVEKEMLVCFRS